MMNVFAILVVKIMIMLKIVIVIDIKIHYNLLTKL